MSKFEQLALINLAQLMALTVLGVAMITAFVAFELGHRAARRSAMREAEPLRRLRHLGYDDRIAYAVEAVRRVAAGHLCFIVDGVAELGPGGARHGENKVDWSELRAAARRLAELVRWPATAANEDEMLKWYGLRWEGRALVVRPPSQQGPVEALEQALWRDDKVDLQAILVASQMPSFASAQEALSAAVALLEFRSELATALSKAYRQPDATGSGEGAEQ